MKQGWEIKKLKEVCAKITDGTHQTPKYFDEGVIFLSSKNVTSGKIDWDNIKYIDEKQHLEMNKRVAPRIGDILLAKNGTTGVAAMVDRDLVFDIYVSLAHIRVLGEVTPEFMLYFINSPTAKKQFNKRLKGSGVPNLHLEEIREVEIPIPALQDQQRIVAILDEAFAAIDKAKTNAQQNLKNAKELFESYLQGVFENKGEGWEEKSLGEVLVKTETVDPTKKPNEEFIYLDVSSVNKETKEIENATNLLGKDAPSRARKLVRTNDVIFATVRPTHSRVALITEDYNEQVCSTGYFVLRAKEFLNNNFVFYFLLTYGFNKQMEKLQKGASYPAVTDAEVKSILIPFPKSISEQKTIVQKLNALSVETKKLEAIYQQKINDLEELKKSVLQKAFAGELKTKEAATA